MSWETASTESYMRSRYPFAFWDIQLLEQGGCVVSARVHDVQLLEQGSCVVSARVHSEAEWKRTQLPRIFDKAERVHQIVNALDNMLRDPNENAWRAHQDYV